MVITQFNPTNSSLMDRTPLLETALFEVKISTEDTELTRKNLSYTEARQMIEDAKKEHAGNPELLKHIQSCEGSFGFSGSSRGKTGVHVYASAARQGTGQMHRCASRDQAFAVDLSGTGNQETPDEWILRGTDRCCSYCGSAHPDDVLALIRSSGWGVIGFTSKGYKWYLNRQNVPNASFGAIKYYRWHDTEDFKAEIFKLSSLQSQPAPQAPLLSVVVEQLPQNLSDTDPDYKGPFNPPRIKGDHPRG